MPSCMSSATDRVQPTFDSCSPLRTTAWAGREEEEGPEREDQGEAPRWKQVEQAEPGDGGRRRRLWAAKGTLAPPQGTEQNAKARRRASWTRSKRSSLATTELRNIWSISLSKNNESWTSNNFISCSVIVLGSFVFVNCGCYYSVVLVL